MITHALLIVITILGSPITGMQSAVTDTSFLESANEEFNQDQFLFPDLGAELISEDMMSNDDKIIYIRDQWRFKAGDDTNWSAKDYDDSGWDILSTNLTQADLAFTDWNGLGWFRKELIVDSTLARKPVALIVDRHLGASEVYLNGNKIRELGTFSVNPDSVSAFNSNQPLTIVFPDSGRHVLAVRFINPNVSETGRLLGNNGFRILLGDWDYYQSHRYSFISKWTGVNMFYIGVLLAVALIHFLLYLFYPIERRNLYFSLFVASLVAMTYLFFRIELSGLTFEKMYHIRFIMVLEIIVLVFATRFTHSLDKERSNKYVNAVLLSGFIFAGIIWLFPAQLYRLRDIVILIYLSEILRSLVLMLKRRQQGIWMIGAGVLVFVIGLVASILINYDVISGNVSVVNMASTGALIFSMSVFLSNDFATTQKNLESKLIEVQELSEKTIRQEKINKERELETKLLEAENRRKTTELEEARSLQLSMLPKKMPSSDEIDIAVFMQTATEVGGDYYDYSMDKNDELVLALGDATGHGLKAGIMVAAAKSYFHTLVHESDSLSMFRKMSSGLRNLNMRLMYMGMIVARYQNRTLDIAIAGMPPVLHYSKADHTIRQIKLKGLPLGSKVNFPYKNEIINLGEGDIVLLMSDGIIELFNKNREMLGIERIEDIIQNSNGYSANDIINQIRQLSEGWLSGMPPNDDITLMAIKIKGN